MTTNISKTNALNVFTIDDISVTVESETLKCLGN